MRYWSLALIHRDNASEIHLKLKLCKFILFITSILVCESFEILHEARQYDILLVISIVELRQLWEDLTFISGIPILGLYSLSSKSFIARLCKISKAQDMDSELSDCSAIWQVSQQQCCLGACQIWEGYNNFNVQSNGFEASRDLVVRHCDA